MRGWVERLGLQRWPDELAGSGHASLASELASNRRWLLSCRLALATSPHPRIAFRRTAVQSAGASATDRASVSARAPSPRGDVLFHQLLQLRWLLVRVLAVASFVDVFEQLSAFGLVA